MIEVVKNIPPPVAQPPTTYTLVGLTERHMRYLRALCLQANSGVALADVDDDFLAATEDFAGKAFSTQGGVIYFSSEQ